MPKNKQHFVCSICLKQFKYSQSLTNHLRIHKDERPLQCPECSYKSRTHSTLKNHIIAIHKKQRVYTCAECDHKFNDHSALRRHRDIHTSKRYSCSHCSKTYKQQPGLSRHIRVHHKQLSISPVEEKNITKTSPSNEVDCWSNLLIDEMEVAMLDQSLREAQNILQMPDVSSLCSHADSKTEVITIINLLTNNDCCSSEMVSAKNDFDIPGS